MKTDSRKSPRRTRTLADPRWEAVVNRDRSADGTFFYSVRTTGVYCRPSCPSRRARPENVDFHETAAAAEQAGFRPCRRCRPDQPGAGDPLEAKVIELCRHIERAAQTPTLQALAQHAGLSPFHLHRAFKRITGLTPKAYALAHGAHRARRELRTPTTTSVADAIYGAGFSSSSRFYAKADAMLGMTPSRYRAGGANAEIRFAIGACALGAILVARSERGICDISIGDDPEALAHALQDRFPNARFVGGDAQFEQLVAQVIAFVEAPRLGLNLPLDVRGTAFQERVWQALRQVPAGTTISYADLAQRIGAPNAVRAVAQACASNTLAVAVPCHRVVRSDGSLSGYRWGVERKRMLLERESREEEESPGET